jgi:hypothetical protein
VFGLILTGYGPQVLEGSRFMNRILMAGTAIAGLFACGTAMAQSIANAPALPGSSIAYTAAGSENSSASALGPTARVDLGGAGYFVILSKSGITDVPASAVTGNIGVSPITGAADHLSCAEVAGKIYSVNHAGPPCSIRAPRKLTNAVGDMQTAYKDAAGRTATVTELGGGNIGGLTLAPAVYSWSTGVNIPTDVTLKGGSHAVWIFQISQNLILASAVHVVLSGHAQAQNIYWQVAGKAVLGTTSHFEGILLSKTLVAMKTGASINGRLLAQTAVTLQKNRVTAP